MACWCVELIFPRAPKQETSDGYIRHRKLSLTFMDDDVMFMLSGAFPNVSFPTVFGTYLWFMEPRLPRFLCRIVTPEDNFSRRRLVR